MKWFNLMVITALLGLFWMSSTDAEPGTLKYEVIGTVNAKFADATWDSPKLYTSKGSETLALDQSEATQYYLRNWFGTMVCIMLALNLAFYAGQISRHGNGQWQRFKISAYNKSCDLWERRPWAKKKEPTVTNTTEVFESV